VEPRPLEDVAWMASDIVREERPAVLHAHPGVRGCEIARVGLALRERHGIPVVYEARGVRDANSLVPEGKPSSELARRRRAVEVATLAAVDAVVVAESEADDLAALGAEEDRLFLVPDGDATDGALDATVARLADAYAHACGSRRGESGR
jgi:hypothetical protein